MSKSMLTANFANPPSGNWLQLQEWFYIQKDKGPDFNPNLNANPPAGGHEGAKIAKN